MEEKQCPSCGSAVSEGVKYCEDCGAAINGPTTGGSTQSDSTGQTGQQAGGKKHILLIAGIAVVLVIAAAAIFGIMIGGKIAGSTPSPGGTTPKSTITTGIETTIPATAAPTPAPDPYPDALKLKSIFPFGSGSVASEAIVYRYWVNDTYQWLNPSDNKYYIQKPSPGYRYLFVFVEMTNRGDTRVWFLPATAVQVYFDGTLCQHDQDHYLPDKSVSAKQKPLLIKEVQYFRQMNNDEFAEDFGYIHGNRPDFLYPGDSNAIDGYIIYEVPLSFAPDQAYVVIPFNGKDTGVWKFV
jgi:hypothetical protein